MTGLNDTDIRLNSEWQLTQATDGDAPLCSGLECLYQNIVLEALTQGPRPTSTRSRPRVCSRASRWRKASPPALP